MSSFSKYFFLVYKNLKKKKYPIFYFIEDKTQKRRLEEIRKREKIESFFINVKGDLPTFFDNISFELFQLLMKSYIWAKENNLPDLSTDVVILHILLNSLKNFQAVSKKSERNYEKLLKNNLTQIVKERVFELREPIEKFLISIELIESFEKATSLAENEFKTPFLTPEIFLLALSKSSTSKIQKVFQKIFPTRGLWENFKYYLIKNIYIHDFFTKNHIFLNQRLFFYFFRKNFSHIFIKDGLTSLPKIYKIKKKNRLEDHFLSFSQAVLFEEFRKKQVYVKNFLLQYYKYKRIFIKSLKGKALRII